MIFLCLVIVALLIERGWSTYQHRKYVERVSDLLTAKSLTEAATAERMRDSLKMLREKRTQKRERAERERTSA